MAAIDDLINDAIDDRLTGVDLQIFSSYVQGGTSTWSTSAWCADFDFSGMSFFDDDTTNFNTVLISPRNALSSAHGGTDVALGSELEFVDRDGTLVTRTVASREKVADNPIETDTWVIHLNADMPINSNGVPWTFYKVLAENYDDFLVSPTGGSAEPLKGNPVIVIDAQRKGLVHEVGAPALDSLKFTRIIPPVTGDRSDYSEALVGGDSSNPTFVVVDDELVVVGNHWFANQDSNFTTNISGINTAMSNLGSAYQLTQYNLGAVLQSVSQVTALSVMGIAGPARSFVAKTPAGAGIFSLAAFQSLSDGMVEGQSLRDGTAQFQSRVDGKTAFQSRPQQ